MRLNSLHHFDFLYNIIHHNLLSSRITSYNVCYTKLLRLEYDLNKEKITMNLEGYDVLYYTKNQNDEENLTSYYINGKNSNIIINDKYKAISDKYNFIFENTQTKIDLFHKSTSVKYSKNEKGKVLISGKNMNDQFLNALIGKKIVEGGNINIEAEGINDIVITSYSIHYTKLYECPIHLWPGRCRSFAGL